MHESSYERDMVLNVFGLGRRVNGVKVAEDSDPPGSKQADIFNRQDLIQRWKPCMMHTLFKVRLFFMSLEFKIIDNICVICLDNTLNKQTIDAFKQLFRNQVEQKGMRKFICDMSNLTFLDTAGLSGLLICLKSAVKHEGDLRLANMHEEPQLIFKMTSAYKVLRIYDSLESALNSYAATSDLSG